MSPLTCEALQLNAQDLGWADQSMHSCLKMPLVYDSLKKKSVPWMREHKEWGMHSSCVLDTHASLRANSGLPSSIWMIDPKPGQDVCHKFGSIVLSMDVPPAL